MKIHGQRLLKTHWIPSQPIFLSPRTGTKQLHMPSALITLCQIHHTPDDDIKTNTVYATTKKSRPVYIMKTKHFRARGKYNKITRFIHKYAKIPTPNGTTGTNRHHTAPTGTKPAYTDIKPTSTDETGTTGINRHRFAKTSDQKTEPGNDNNE